MENAEFYMKMALEQALSGKGFVSPNPMVGAVIVKNGKVLAKGYHHKYGSLHAERDAFANLTEDCAGADMYVTLEPCCHYGKQPPCTDAIIEHGIKRIFIGSKDPNPIVNGRGRAILQAAGIEVHEGILKEECDRINHIFFHYITKKIPYYVCKYAMTADGKIAAYTGDSKWISCEEARQRVHRMRGEYRGIMAGINTVLSDDPMLNCRTEGLKSPVRIICDSRLKIPVESKIVKTAKEYETIVATVSRDNEKIERLKKAGVQVIATSANNGQVNLRELSARLGEMKIDSILVEGGGELNFSVMKAGLCKRIFAFISPKILGGSMAKTPVEGVGIERVKDCLKLNLLSVQKTGDDVLLEYEVI